MGKDYELLHVPIAEASRVVRTRPAMLAGSSDWSFRTLFGRDATPAETAEIEAWADAAPGGHLAIVARPGPAETFRVTVTLDVVTRHMLKVGAAQRGVSCGELIYLALEALKREERGGEA
jgi:hypothetical protein